MTVEEFFAVSCDREHILISYQDRKLTYKTFFDTVAMLKKQLEAAAVSRDAYYLIDEEDPLCFYPILVAAWLLDMKIVFPSRDFFLNRKGLNLHEFTLSYSARKGLAVNINEHYCALELPEEGNTIVFSSGSTGAPKGIVHKREHFIENALGVIDQTDFLSASTVTMLKPYLVSALSHFLVHFKNGAHLAFLDMNAVSSIRDLCAAYEINTIVGSPMHIVNAYQLLGEYSAQVVRYFSSGDIMYPNVMEEILRNNQQAIFYDVYGLAELAGRFFINALDYRSPVKSFTCLGQNIQGTAYTVAEKQIMVSSPFLFLGYVIEGRFEARHNEQPFATGDMVEGTNNCLEFVGRKNEEIKIAGNKVSTKHIEIKLASIFTDVTVIIVSSEHKLSTNILNMIIYGQVQYDKRTIIQRIHHSRLLKPYEMPHMFYRIDALPYTTTMKIDRSRIKAALPGLEIIK